MEKQLEFAFDKTFTELVNEINNYQNKIQAIDGKIEVLDELMKDASGSLLETYEELKEEALIEKEEAQRVIDENVIEKQQMILENAKERKNMTEVERAKRAYQRVASKIEKNNEDALEYQSQMSLFQGLKAKKNNEIREMRAKVENIKDVDLVKLNEKQENLEKVEGNYDVETLKKDIEGYTKWLGENKVAIKLINKYLKMKGVNKEMVEELKKDKEIFTNETKEIKQEIKESKSIKTKLTQENKVDAQIKRANKRYTKKSTLLEQLRDEASEYQAKELFNKQMYQNLLAENEKLRDQASEIKAFISSKEQKEEERAIEEEAKKVAFVEDKNLAEEYPEFDFMTSQN